MRILFALLTCWILLTAAAPAAHAQFAAPADTVFTRPRLGVGAQLTWPAYGLSALYDVNDRLSVQGVVGTSWGYGLTFTGRALYRLQPQELFTPYAFGAVGVWTGYLGYSAPNFGVGGGIELDARRFFEGVPPLFVGLEAGINVVTYPGGAVSYLEVGPSIHYRF